MRTHESQRIGKSGRGFVVPSGLPRRHRLMSRQRVCEQGNNGEQPQQCRSRAGNRQICPLALGFDPEMRADFVKRHFHLPTVDEPGHYRGRMAPSGARPSTGPEKRSAPRAGQRLAGAVARRWRPPARSLRGRDRRYSARVSLVSVEVVVLGAGERATRSTPDFPVHQGIR